jgi:hypothetical protein
VAERSQPRNSTATSSDGRITMKNNYTTRARSFRIADNPIYRIFRPTTR